MLQPQLWAEKAKTPVEEIMLSEISKTNNGLQPFTPTMGKLISSLGRLKIASSLNLQQVLRKCRSSHVVFILSVHEADN